MPRRELPAVGQGRPDLTACKASQAAVIVRVAPAPVAWSDGAQGRGQGHLPSPVSVTSSPSRCWAPVDVTDQKLLLPSDGTTE